MAINFSPTPSADDVAHAGNSPVTALATGNNAALASSTLGTVVTHTASGQQSVSRIAGSGTFPAEWTLVLNSVILETKRSGPDYKVEFLFNGPLTIPDTQVLDIKVEHLDAANTRDFNATIYGA